MALQRAREFSEYHPTFAKYENRKKLTPQQKAQITRKWKELTQIAGEAGGLGYLSVVNEKAKRKLQRDGNGELLLGGFNILKLNRYDENATIEVSDQGDLVQRRKYDKSRREDLKKGRQFTFVAVDCNFSFWTRRYDALADDGEIYDVVKEKIIARYRATYEARKKKLPKSCEFYLWGKQGVMYKRAASSFELLMVYLGEWVDLYLDRVIEADESLKNELLGWCWHGNVQLRKKPAKKPTKGMKRGKNRNR